MAENEHHHEEAPVDTFTARVLYAVGRRTEAIMLGLLAVSVVMAILATLGFVKARDAQTRVNQVEIERATEARGKQIADVSTCFAQARGRPKVIEIFNAIAGTIPDPVPRAALRELIGDYSERTPTVEKCVALSHQYGLDPTDYDPGARQRTPAKEEEKR
jgi:hypothetical protein